MTIQYNLRKGLMAIGLLLTGLCISYTSNAQGHDGINCDGSGNQEWIPADATLDASTDPSYVNNSHNIDSFWIDSDPFETKIAMHRENGGNVGVKMFFDIDGTAGGNSSENNADYAFFFSIDNNCGCAADSSIYRWNNTTSVWDLTTDDFSALNLGSSCNTAADDKFFEVLIDLDDFNYNFCTSTTTVTFTHMKTNAGASFTSADKDEIPVNVAIQSSIDPDPVAAISVNDICNGETLTLDGTGSTGSQDGGTTNSNSLIASYEWDLDNNGTYDYTQGGTYDSTFTITSSVSQTVALRVTDIYGCTSTKVTETWNGNPNPSGTASGSTSPATSGKCKDKVFVYTASATSGASPFSYSWAFPNATPGFDYATTTSTTQNHTYSQCFWTISPNTVYLTITDANGCSSSSIPVTPPVPVDLVYFDGEVKDGAAELKWQTASEINNSHFVLAKSLDGEFYGEIAQIEGSGNSMEILDYRFIDPNMEDGDVYYQLTQVDFDGKSETFAPIVLNKSADKGRIIVSPNPVSDVVSITLPVHAQASELVIMDLNGKELLKQSIQGSRNAEIVEMQLSEFPEGLYYVRFGNAIDGYVSELIQLL